MYRKTKLDIQHKYSFSSSSELVDYVLKHNFILDQDEVGYIFNHIVCKNTMDKLSPKYKNLSQSVKFLLTSLNNKQREQLLQLINSDFEFKTEFQPTSYLFDGSLSGEKFTGYSFSCKNPETCEGIIALANKIRHKKIKNETTSIKL